MTFEPSIALQFDKQEVLQAPGVQVSLAHDTYPEGHQGGVGMILHDLRVFTNGDLRLESSPGQWSPIPMVGDRTVLRESQRAEVHMRYPDDSKNRRGFNPIEQETTQGAGDSSARRQASMAKVCEQSSPS